MIVVLQRVREASVTVGEETVGAIDAGLVALVGVATEDGDAEVDHIARKTAELRIFEDEDGKMNRSVEETGGSVLAVSQFTLLADTRKGRRPSFVRAARPEQAEPLFERYVAALRARGVPVETGRFGARMLVRIENAGPVTVLLESAPAPARASPPAQAGPSNL